jgi:hypothetical protein
MSNMPSPLTSPMLTFADVSDVNLEEQRAIELRERVRRDLKCSRGIGRLNIMLYFALTAPAEQHDSREYSETLD